MILLFVLCVPPHVATKVLFGRSGWPKRFLAAAARICGAKVTVTGKPIEPHTLLVCNHVSWLDILVVGGATGCSFVSKHELGHPLIHWMADQGHTLYVRRDQRRDASGQAESIARKLEDAAPLALFPEGTTGPGTHMLPFRSTLFAAVAPAPPEVSVRPVAVDYGEASPDVGWYEEAGKDNVLRTLGRPGRLPVTLRVLDPLPRTADRKAMAETAREAIAKALTSSRGAANL